MSNLAFRKVKSISKFYLVIFSSNYIYMQVYTDLMVFIFQPLEGTSVGDYNLYILGMLSSWTWLALKENGGCCHFF